MIMQLFTHEDGYYALTGTGMAVAVILTAALIILTAFIHTRGGDEKGKKQLFTTKQLVFSAVALALAFALSYVKIFHMPWGGSVTLCSMLFVSLIGYWYGPQIGLISAFAYGMLQFIQEGGSYILSPLQVCLDYLFAFTALGVSGFFSKKKNGLVTGYIAGVLLRGLLHSIGGYLYWMDYMPDNFPKSLTVIYPFCYNYAYLIAEAMITLVIICIPAVSKALGRLRTMAV